MHFFLGQLSHSGKYICGCPSSINELTLIIYIISSFETIFQKELRVVKFTTNEWVRNEELPVVTMVTRVSLAK